MIPKCMRINLYMLRNKTSATIGSLRKPLHSRVDYNQINYCSTCNVKLPKQTLRCPDCKQKQNQALAPLKTYN